MYVCKHVHVAFLENQWLMLHSIIIIIIHWLLYISIISSLQSCTQSTSSIQSDSRCASCPLANHCIPCFTGYDFTPLHHMNVSQLATHVTYLGGHNDTIAAIHDHKLDGYTLVSLTMKSETNELNAMNLKVCIHIYIYTINTHTKTLIIIE